MGAALVHPGGSLIKRIRILESGSFLLVKSAISGKFECRKLEPRALESGKQLSLRNPEFH